MWAFGVISCLFGQEGETVPRCGSCGGVATGEARFCSRCGASMANGKAQAPYAHAPTPGVLKSAKADLDRAVRRLLEDRRRLREAGYRSGVELAADELLDAEWFRYWMGLDPQLLREQLNHRNDDVEVDEEILERVLALFEEHTGLDAGGPDQDGMGLAEEDVVGGVGGSVEGG